MVHHLCGEKQMLRMTSHSVNLLSPLLSSTEAFVHNISRQFLLQYIHKLFSICSLVILAKPQYEQAITLFRCKKHNFCFPCLLIHLLSLFLPFFLLQIGVQTALTALCHSSRVRSRVLVISHQ